MKKLQKKRYHMRKLEEILNKSIDKSNDSVKLARESIEYMAKDDF